MEKKLEKIHFLFTANISQGKVTEYLLGNHKRDFQTKKSQNRTPSVTEL